MFLVISQWTPSAGVAADYLRDHFEEVEDRLAADVAVVVMTGPYPSWEALAMTVWVYGPDGSGSCVRVYEGPTFMDDLAKVVVRMREMAALEVENE